MASAKKTVKRQLKPAETVRERAEKAAQPKQPRRVKRAASTAKQPIGSVGRFLRRVFRPLSFLLAPFRTKPLRFIGRVLSKILFLNYFKESWRELKKVTWPNRRQTFQLTMAVFAFAIFFGVLIAGVDFVLDKVFRSLILK